MKNFFLACKQERIEPTIPKTYYSCFYLGPFRDSHALTVANALRRTLLTDISGLAITSVNIEGINHEYSVLKGVRETTIDILLNLKDIVIKKTVPNSIKETQLGYLQAKGPGVIRAKDLKLPPMFQCINPDQYIATLSQDGQLSLTITIEEGKNFIYRQKFSNSLQFSQFNAPIADTFLEIDSIFNPVKKVNYLIESYGSKSIYNKNQVVVLEIWTNGTISPKEALAQTLNSLNLLFNNLGKLKSLDSILTTYTLEKNKNFRNNLKILDQDLTCLKFTSQKKKNFKNKYKLTNQIAEKNTSNVYELKKPVNDNSDLLNQNIIALGLPFKIFTLLYKAKIFKIEELLKLNEPSLGKILNFDQQLLSIINEIIKSKGLNFF